MWASVESNHSPSVTVTLGKGDFPSLLAVNSPAFGLPSSAQGEPPPCRHESVRLVFRRIGPVCAAQLVFAVSSSSVSTQPPNSGIGDFQRRECAVCVWGTWGDLPWEGEAFVAIHHRDLRQCLYRTRIELLTSFAGALLNLQCMSPLGRFSYAA